MIDLKALTICWFCWAIGRLRIVGELNDLAMTVGMPTDVLLLDNYRCALRMTFLFRTVSAKNLDTRLQLDDPWSKVAG